jgi:hypothetical protein
MRLRNITLAGMILIVLAFTIGMAGAIENGTGNETPLVNITGNSTETLTVNVTGNSTETLTVNVTGNSTETLTVPPNATVSPEADDDETEDEGLIGPGNAFYGLKIAFENIGEVFIFDPSEKLGKQVSHARKRIAEARAALKRNDAEAANKALAEYEEKMSELNGSMSKLSGKDTGLVNAQQMILKHQLILANLSIQHPNSTGLLRAYNNSKNLEVKHASKIEQKLDINSVEKHQKIAKAENTGVSTKEERPERGHKKSN